MRTRNSGKQAMSEVMILASGSPYRRQMLEAAGVAFEVRVGQVDEDALKRRLLDEDPDMDGAAVALALAEEKARSVSLAAPGRVVVGADQVLVCGGEIFSKPVSREAARQQLVSLRGLTHALPTAVVAMVDSVVVWSTVDEPQLTMRRFSDRFLDHYLAAEGDGVLSTVGGYKIEGHGVQLFDSIDGNGFTIVGLPLLPLLGYLRRADLLVD